MNSQTHSMIFSKARGYLMAVGEIARSSAVCGCSGSKRSKRQGITASNVLADRNINLSAGANVNITAAQNTQSSSRFNETRQSGLLSGGGLAVTLGKQQQSLDAQGQSTSAAQSTIGSLGGNVTINAGQTYTQTGSDVLTPGGDIAITAQKANITEARETGNQSTEQKVKQSGVTVALTSGLVSSLQMANSQIKAAGNTSSDRMKALATVNAAAGVVQAAQNATQLNVSITAGSSSSQSKQDSSADTAKGSNLNAGGSVTIQASGAGQGSNITIQGSTVKAGQATTFKADGDVNLLAAANTAQESTSSKNSSASAGMSAGTGGLGFIASASAGKGNGSGNSTTYTNTQVSGNTVNIDSGGDTTLKGAVVTGEQVTAKVGGHLNIQSLQDISTYKEKSSQAGGSVFVGAGASGPVSGNVNVGQTKINSDYTSVNEQSAIRAGDGGFNVNVQGKTDLIGGQITSTQAAIENNKNSYEAKQGTTTTDLQNGASYSAQSVSVGLGAGALPGKSASAGMSGVGIGSDSGNAQSTTTAGISGIAGNTAARTGDKSTGITPIFNQTQVKQEVAAQVAITSEFGKQASKLGGTEADKQRDALKAQATQAEKNGDTAQAQSLQAEAAKWDEGGTYRVAMHSVIGGLTGGTAGAVGAGAASAAAPGIDQLQTKLQDGLKSAGLGDSAAKVIAGLAGGATAATVGAVASSGSVAGSATAFNADMNNRQLHPTEAKLIQDNAKRYAQQRYSTTNPTAEQIKGAEIELANTAQNMVDNNMGVTVPKIAQAEVFLNQLKVEYAQATGSVNIGGTSGQAGGTQQLFYASTEQKNMPWLNQGLANPAITGLIVKTPINPPKPTDKVDLTRDRLTGLPLDEKGRFTVNVALGDPINGYTDYSPKYLPCATADCMRIGKNLDMSDPSTQAYVKALDAQVFKDINTAGTVGTLITPAGVAGNVLGILGPLTSIAAGYSEDNFSTSFAKEGLQLAAASYLKGVYGLSEAITNRITATVDLAGGWQAFIDRTKTEIEKVSK